MLMTKKNKRNSEARAWLRRTLATAVTVLASVASMMAMPAAHDSDDSLRVERPVASFFMAEVGSTSVIDTYLAPVAFKGVDARLEYERMQAMRFDPQRWVMQMHAGVEYGNLQNKPGNHTEHMLMVDYRWGMMRRWSNVLTPNLQAAVGGSTQLRGGAVYKPSNSNNLVTAKIHWAVSLTAMASYKWRVAKMPVVISYQATLPVAGVFFSPEYGETYYEIYLGNHSGLAHFGWWGSRFDMTNALMADMHLGSTVLRVGYRNTIERSWVNNLDTQIVTHMAVIGVGGEWISLGGNKPNGEKARIISAMY